MIRETFDYPDYLSVKKSVDDACLNPAVWSAMADWLISRQARHMNILEIGAGVGTMIERIVSSGLLNNCTYTAIELEEPFRNMAYVRLENWSNSNHFSIIPISDKEWKLSGNGGEIYINWISGDILNIKSVISPESQDLIIGHAVIDLLPVPVCLPDLLGCLKPGGGFYFSLNFAGQTLFSPLHPLDEKIIPAYHGDMDSRFPGLDWRPSRTGSLLSPWLIRHGNRIIAEGPSNWTLPIETMDLDSNRLFISNILDTIAKALSGMDGLEDWLSARRSQLDKGKLELVVTNRDLFGSVPS